MQLNVHTKGQFYTVKQTPDLNSLDCRASLEIMEEIRTNNSLSCDDQFISSFVVKLLSSCPDLNVRLSAAIMCKYSA